MNATQPHSTDEPKGMTRRSVLNTAAWAVPVVAVAAAVPALAASTAREYNITSGFGVGWYPTTQGQTANGALQYDAATADTSKSLKITGTLPGDVITGISFQVLISTAWPAPTFTALPGSNSSWTTLASTGTTTVVDGVTYNIYSSSYVAPVVATAGETVIPINFFFRSTSPYYAGTTAQTRRFANVNGTDVTVIRNPAAVNNTNVLLANAPRP